MTSELSDARFATFASRGVLAAWLETSNMPSNFKKLVRARMAKTEETYQTAARHVRAAARVGREEPDVTVANGSPGAQVAPTDAAGGLADHGSSAPAASPKGTKTNIENLAAIRELARQFHIDHVGRYDIAVDAKTLACTVVPKPWYTLRECGGKRTTKTLPFDVPPGWRRPSGDRLRVFVVDAGICIGATSVAGGRLSRDEALRFTVAVAGRNVAPGCAPDRDEKDRDWAWGQMNRGNRVTVTYHSVLDADLAHEREADVREAVAGGRYPVLLSVGAKRAAAFAVIEKPVSPHNE